MNKICVIVLVFAITVLAQGSVNYYDGQGRYDGSATKSGNTTNYYDGQGRYTGQAIEDANGNIQYYDGQGRYTGSRTR